MDNALNLTVHLLNPSTCLLLSFLALLFWDSLLLPFFLSLCHPSSSQHLASRTVLITGAGRPQGIGYHLARSFLQAGCHVVLWDIDAEALQQARQTLQSSVPPATPSATPSPPTPLSRITTQVVDVSNSLAVQTAATELKAKGIQISVLVNNAGVVRGKSVTQLTPTHVSTTFNVNVLAHFHTLATFLPHMVLNNDGLVVTMSSMMGMMGGARLADYCASKWALLGMDESLRMELRRHGSSRHGVRTMVVCPYMVSTGMFRGAFGNVSSSGSGGERSSGSRSQAGTSLLRRCVQGLRDCLVPQLTPEQVAAAVVVAAGQRLIPSRWSSCGAHGKVLVLPQRLSVIPAVLRLLPIGMQEFVIDYGGGTLGMEGFVGYQNQKET